MRKTAPPVRVVQGPYMQEQHDCILATMWGVGILGAVGKVIGREVRILL